MVQIFLAAFDAEEFNATTQKLGKTRTGGDGNGEGDGDDDNQDITDELALD